MLSTFLIWIGVMVVFGIGMKIYHAKTYGKRFKEFQEQHPDAARIKLGRNRTNLIQFSSVMIETVDGEKPALGTEGMDGIVLLTPGRHELQVYATYNYLKKNHTTDLVSLWVDVVPHGVYRLSYEIEDAKFVFQPQ